MTEGLLRCGGCCVLKSVNDFAKNRCLATGRNFYCRQCSKEMRDSRTEGQKERHRQKQYLWRQRNLELWREKQRVRMRAYRQKMREAKVNG